MSPILFDIFINDIFRHCADLGVSVPGLDHKVPGLMFADDIVLLSSTSDGLTSMLNTAQDWAHKWEMRFGVSKCGITVFNHDIETLRERNWILNDELVPVVDRYTYLGIEVHSSLDINEVVKVRKAKALKALMAMQPFLMTRSIPMVIRARVLRTLVYPVAFLVFFTDSFIIYRIENLLSSTLCIIVVVTIHIGGLPRTDSPRMTGTKLTNWLSW